MARLSVEEMAARIAALMEHRLGAPGHGLRAKIDSRGRALPRRVRRAAERLAAAADLAHVPKLAHRIDMGEAARSYRTCLRYLKPLGTGTRLKNRLLDLGATLGLVLLLAGGAVVAYVIWRGTP